MSGNKTKPTDTGVQAFLDAVDGDERRADCQTLIAMMGRITAKPAVMWGPSIVGFDTYHYRYDRGREGDWLVTGFSPRKGDISVYLTACGADQSELLSRLGRHRMGKACLYLRRLSEIDLAVLEQLVAASVAEVRRRYG